MSRTYRNGNGKSRKWDDPSFRSRKRSNEQMQETNSQVDIEDEIAQRDCRVEEKFYHKTFKTAQQKANLSGKNQYIFGDVGCFYILSEDDPLCFPDDIIETVTPQKTQ